MLLKSKTDEVEKKKQNYYSRILQFKLGLQGSETCWHPDNQASSLDAGPNGRANLV